MRCSSVCTSGKLSASATSRRTSGWLASMSAFSTMITRADLAGRGYGGPGRASTARGAAPLRDAPLSPRFARMSPAPRKPWGGRFREATDPAVERFTASIAFDQALARHDVRTSLAHVRMLRRQGLVGEADERALVAGLEAI